MANVDVDNFRRFFFTLERDLMYRHLKSLVLQVSFEMKYAYINIVVDDIPTQILLTILLFIDHFSWCKLNVYIIHTAKRNCARKNDTLRKIDKKMKVKRVRKKLIKCSSDIHLIQFKN